MIPWTGFFLACRPERAGNPLPVLQAHHPGSGRPHPQCGRRIQMGHSRGEGLPVPETELLLWQQGEPSPQLECEGNGSSVGLSGAWSSEGGNCGEFTYLPTFCVDGTNKALEPDRPGRTQQLCEVGNIFQLAEPQIASFKFMFSFSFSLP